MHKTELLRAKATCLALGVAGGALFYVLHLPLPWMLGAMAATTVAATSGVRVALMPTLRMIFIAILGVMLGSAFTPQVLQSLFVWVGSFGWLVIYVILATAIAYLFYRRIAGYDTV